MKTVYTAFDRRVAFMGTDQECWNYIVSNCFQMKDGSRIYRKWIDEFGDTFYDTDGGVFIYNGNTK